MKIYVISLPEADSRRASVAQQMKSLGLPYTLIDGVRIDPVRLGETPYNKPGRLLRYGYDMVPGEVGCFMAHQAVWRAVQAQEGKCLILEDDVLLTGLNSKLLDLLEMAPYRMIRIAGIFNKPHKFVSGTSFAKYWGDPSGSAAYVLGPEEATRLIEKSADFYMAVDDFLEARHLHGINTYGLLPYPVQQAGIDTHIGNRKRPRLSGITRFKRMLVRIPIDISKYFYRISHYIF